MRVTGLAALTKLTQLHLETPLADTQQRAAVEAVAGMPSLKCLTLGGRAAESQGADQLRAWLTSACTTAVRMYVCMCGCLPSLCCRIWPH